MMVAEGRAGPAAGREGSGVVAIFDKDRRKVSDGGRRGAVDDEEGGWADRSFSRDELEDLFGDIFDPKDQSDVPDLASSAK